MSALSSRAFSFSSSFSRFTSGSAIDPYCRFHTYYVAWLTPCSRHNCSAVF